MVRSGLSGVIKRSTQCLSARFAGGSERDHNPPIEEAKGPHSQQDTPSAKCVLMALGSARARPARPLPPPPGLQAGSLPSDDTLHGIQRAAAARLRRKEPVSFVQSGSADYRVDFRLAFRGHLAAPWAALDRAERCSPSTPATPASSFGKTRRSLWRSPEPPDGYSACTAFKTAAQPWPSLPRRLAACWQAGQRNDDRTPPSHTLVAPTTLRPAGKMEVRKTLSRLSHGAYYRCSHYSFP